MRYDIWDTLQGINISYLGKRKIIFKYAILGGYVSSQEGIPLGDLASYKLVIHLNLPP